MSPNNTHKAQLLTCLFLFILITMNSQWNQRAFAETKEPRAEVFFDSYPVVNGTWLTDKPKASTETLEEFENLNSITAYTLFAMKSSPRIEFCNKGLFPMSNNFWDACNDKEKQYVGDLVARGRLSSFCVKKSKAMPILPSKYVSTLKKVISQYSDNAGIKKSFFTRLLLTTAQLFDSNAHLAEKTIAPLKVSCDSESAKKSPDSNTCWADFASDIPGGDDSAYELLDGIEEVIGDNGIFYVQAPYNILKFQSKAMSGTRLMYDITVVKVSAEKDYNVIYGYIGFYSAEQQMNSYPGPDFGTMTSQLAQVSSRRNSERLIIHVPQKLSDNLLNLEYGSHIIVKGKAAGKEDWNYNIGYVPLILAEKIEKK